MFWAFFWGQIALVLAGLWLAWVALRGRRVDDHLHCRKCGYDLFGLGVRPAVCPECGADLRQRASVQFGVVRRRPALAVLALLCFFAAYALGPIRARMREWVARPLAFAYAVRVGAGDDVEAHLAARPGLINLRPPGQSLLDMGVAGGSEEVVKRLLAAGADPNEVGSGNSYRPLHRAAWEDKPGICHVLLAGGADPNVKDGNGERPLHFAARRPGPGTIPKILLAKGADPNARDARARTPLHSAASGRDVEVVQALIDGKADVNATNDDGRTPLHLAAARRDWDVTATLLKAGALLSARDRAGKLPAQLAREGDADAGIQFTTRMLQLALRDGRSKAAREDVRQALKADPGLLREGGRQGTLLHVAAALRQTDLARVLVEAGADVAARDATGKTALHRACWGHDPPTVKLLVKSGADPNARDNDGRTPLHVAGDSPARAETAVLLLEHGADLSVKDKQGLTPAEAAATSPQDARPEFLEAVVSHGGKPDVYAAALLGREDELAKLLEKDPSLVDGGPGPHVASPLHVAAAYGKAGVARILLDRGADPNSGVDVKGGATRAGKTPPGRTPLFDAVGKGHADVAKLLLERGARPGLANAGGGTPLHVAAAVGEKCVRVLLDHGADANARDDLKTTPLHWAAGYSDVETVKALVEAGADVTAKDAVGLSALDHANRGNRRRPEVARYLAAQMQAAGAPTTAPSSVPSTAPSTQATAHVVHTRCALTSPAADGAAAPHSGQRPEAWPPRRS